MVPTVAKTNGLDPIPVQLAESYDVDVDGMLDIGAQITYLCTPNNPTGTPLTRGAIEAVVDRAKGFVVLDEAYVDFASDNFSDLVRRSPRVLIARTFSKAFGLAGARVGYGIASPELITEIEKARGPYKLTAISERAACAAVVEDVEWVRQKVKLAVASREWLRAELAKRDVRTPPSEANFLLVPVPHAQEIARHMAAKGIAVRPFANLPRVDALLSATNGEALRITVAPQAALERMLEAFDAAIDAVRTHAA
jgi:histidinol-phosphate aminotransferase